MAVKIGVINQKGGVGKTTISNALSFEASKGTNLDTLLIDFDPQASQTILLNLNPREFLKESNIEFKEVDVGSNLKAAQEMVKKSGQMGVPVIEINGQIIVGFDKEALRRALKL